MIHMYTIDTSFRPIAALIETFLLSNVCDKSFTSHNLRDLGIDIKLYHDKNPCLNYEVVSKQLIRFIDKGKSETSCRFSCAVLFFFSF